MSAISLATSGILDQRLFQGGAPPFRREDNYIIAQVKRLEIKNMGDEEDILDKITVEMKGLD